MAKDLLHVLRAVGFDEKEADLYLTGLQMGTAPASEYGKRASLNRVTAYNALESLVQRGFFTVVKKMRGKWYAPVSPEFLAVEARKNAEALNRSLPELRSLQGAKYRSPRVRFFEGWEGVRHVYEDTLTAKSELLNFANSAVVRKFWPKYDEEYVEERVKRGIHLRGIAPDDAAGRRVHGEDTERLREIRLVPASDFDFTNEINIYDSKVAICSFSESRIKNLSERAGLAGPAREGHNKGKREPAREEPLGSSFAMRDMFGVIIESKEVAETQKQIFEMAWRYAGLATKVKLPPMRQMRRELIA